MQTAETNWLIVNKGSGSARHAGFWLSQLAEHGIQASQLDVSSPRELKEPSAAGRLLVAGGDGTVRRFVGWCIEHGWTLGVLPAGTGNDFARGLGIPLNPVDACRVAANGIARAVDVGYIGDRLFLNVAHIGMGADISLQTASHEKKRWGRLVYLRKLLETIRRSRGFFATVQCEGERVSGRWLEIVVANGGSFGGGHQVFEATPFDGELDVVGVRPKPFTRLLRVWAQAWWHAQTPSDEAVVVLRSARCEVKTHKPRAITADGESAGDTPTLFSVEPATLKVMLPEQSAGAAGA